MLWRCLRMIEYYLLYDPDDNPVPRIITYDGSEPLLDWMYRHIRCSSIETVRLDHVDPKMGIVAIVDEEGLLRASHVNRVATRMAGTWIFGGMLIGTRDGEPEIVGYPTPEQASDIARYLYRIHDL